MLKTSTELVSFNVIRVWITKEKVRDEVREYIADYIDQANAGELEIPSDRFMDAQWDMGVGKGLSTDAMYVINSIGTDLDRMPHITGVIFAKKEEDSMESPYE